MIVDALKGKAPPEIAGIVTPLKDTTKFLLTPGSEVRSSRDRSPTSYTRHQRNTSASSSNHSADRRRSRSRSPARLDFCPRCLDSKHKMHKCPHISQKCST